MKINTRVRLNTAISIGVGILILFSLVWAFREIIIADRKIQLAEELRLVAFDRIMLRDEYILYPEERTKTQWYAKSETLRDLLAQAAASFDDKKDKAVLQDALKDFEAILSGFSKFMEDRARQAPEGNTKPHFSDAESQLVSQVFVRAHSLTDNIKRLHASGQRAATNARNRGALILLVSVFGGFIAVTVNSITISRILQKRISALNKGVEILGAGDLEHHIAVEGDDELSKLALASNEMAAKLKVSYTSVENLKKEITERKKAERVQFRLLNIIEKSLNEIYVFDADTLKFEYLNNGASQNIGYTLSEMRNMTPLDIKPKYTETLFREMVRPLVNKEKERIVFETIHRRKNGTAYPVLVYLQFYSEEGKNVFFAVINDITEGKKAEAEIQKLNQELEQRVVERTSQLEAANRELDAFSYTVSHDLRAPLRHLVGFVELLNKKSRASLDEKTRHYLTVISDSATQMSRLIDDLLSFSRMGRAEMLKARVSIDRLVHEAMNTLQTETRGREIDWKIKPLPEVEGDAAMLRLVVINLISNAVKFTRTRTKAVIEVGYNDDKDEHVFYVRDNGVGFDMRYTDKLFNLFQRLHRTEEFEGTGVGLANVRRIIQRHNGRVWAEGALNEGATFYFSLPKHKEAI